MPLGQLVQALEPAAPREVLAAAPGVAPDGSDRMLLRGAGGLADSRREPAQLEQGPDLLFGVEWSQRVSAQLDLERFLLLGREIQLRGGGPGDREHQQEQCAACFPQHVYLHPARSRRSGYPSSLSRSRASTL